MQNRIKIFRSSGKISRLCACSVVVVCATEEKEAQTGQRNEQTVRATSESARMDAGRGGTRLATMKRPENGSPKASLEGRRQKQKKSWRKRLQKRKASMYGEQTSTRSAHGCKRGMSYMQSHTCDSRLPNTTGAASNCISYHASEIFR